MEPNTFFIDDQQYNKEQHTNEDVLFEDSPHVSNTALDVLDLNVLASNNTLTSQFVSIPSVEAPTSLDMHEYQLFLAETPEEEQDLHLSFSNEIVFHRTTPNPVLTSIDVFSLPSLKEVDEKIVAEELTEKIIQDIEAEDIKTPSVEMTSDEFFPLPETDSTHQETTEVEDEDEVSLFDLPVETQTEDSLLESETLEESSLGEAQDGQTSAINTETTRITPEIPSNTNLSTENELLENQSFEENEADAFASTFHDNYDMLIYRKGNQVIQVPLTESELQQYFDTSRVHRKNTAPELQKKETDHLLENFLAKQPKMPKMNPHDASQVIDLTEGNEPEPEILTETMAKIHLLQGNKKEAMEIYEKLSLVFPEKSVYFADQIQKIGGKMIGNDIR